MSVLRRLTKSWTQVEQYTTLSERRNLWPSRSGVNVTRDRAMRLGTVWACIRLRAETLGMLPVDVVEYAGKNREQVEPPAWLERPNSETTQFELFERTSASLDTDGNAFWGLSTDRIGRIGEVYVLPPTQVEVYRPKRQNSGDPVQPKRYRFDNKDYGPDEILHIPGFGLAGQLRGMSPIEYHASSIGLGIAAEEFGEAFFGNGAVMSGVIVMDRDPGETAVNRMQSSFQQDHTGLANVHKPGVLFGGAKWEQLTIPNDAAQFIETRNYQVGEIARIFRVPPHKIGDLSRATFSNIEHQGIEWVTDGVMPYTSRIEAAVLSAGMLDRGQRLRFKLAGLMRGDTMSRYAAYAIARQWGWLSVDDIRALEDENPLPEGAGAVYLQPMNMVSAGTEQETVGKIMQAKALVDTGTDPTVAFSSVGLDPIQLLGLLPVPAQEG